MISAIAIEPLRCAPGLGATVYHSAVGDTDAFLTLSIALLGDPELPAQGAAELAELLPVQLGPGFAEAIARWAARPADVPAEAWIEAELWADTAARAVCTGIMMAWLFGAAPTTDSDDPRWAARWFEGRFWTYAHAHVPGLSGGYFGYWSYPPEA